MSAVLKPSDFNASDLADTAEQRYNIYSIIHKGLRGFMTDTLLRWGKADMGDEQERGVVIAQVRGLLDMCHSHLQHENDFVHPALESARLGAAKQTNHDHIEHATAIAELRAQLTAVESSLGWRRAMLAQRFYLRLSAFVAENFEHMIVEETDNHAVLIDAYSDAEILAIEHRLVASLQPEESFIGLRWMIGHINATERAFLLGGMKRGAPPPVFDAVMGLAREVLSQRDFDKLEMALAQ
jgi:Hemerythrin HHE cation binding domain